MRLSLLAVCALVMSACAQSTSTQVAPTSARCATSQEAAAVRTFYSDTRPGAVLPVASRRLQIPEAIVASALLGAHAVGVTSDETIVRAVWDSIDTWGADTQVNLVLTSGGQHGFKFPSEVPITQPGDGDGFLDVYADEGRGVHAHLNLALVRSIFAVDTPGGQGQGRTRSINFYNAGGDLILGVYASMANEPPGAEAVAGFERTREVIERFAQICR